MEVRLLQDGPTLLLRNLSANEPAIFGILKLAFIMRDTEFIQSYIAKNMPIGETGIKLAIEYNQPEIFTSMIKLSTFNQRQEEEVWDMSFDIYKLFKFVIHLENSEQILTFLNILQRQFPNIHQNILKKTLLSFVRPRILSDMRMRRFADIIELLLNRIKSISVEILTDIVNTKDPRSIDIVLKRNKADEIQHLLLIDLGFIQASTRDIQASTYFKLLFNKLIENGADIELLKNDEGDPNDESYHLAIELLETNRKQNESYFTFGNKVAKRNPELGQVMSHVASYLTTPAVIRNPIIGPIQQQQQQPVRIRLPNRNVESMAHLMPQPPQSRGGTKRKRRSHRRKHR